MENRFAVRLFLKSKNHDTPKIITTTHIDEKIVRSIK
jgi:hypothetical protein